MDIYSSNMIMIVNQFGIDLLGISSAIFMNVEFCFEWKKSVVCKILCCYVGLIYSEYGRWLWIHNSMNQQLYKVNEDFEGIKTNLLMGQY